MANKYNADSIVVIKDDRERILQSPNMYVPNKAKEGAIHCIFEIVDNSVDELTIKNSVGNDLVVTYDVTTRLVTVKDNGRGIPHEKLYDALTVLAASGKFNNGENSAYSATGGVFGHGMTVCMVLSKTYKCRSDRDGKYLEYSFAEGLKTSESSGKSSEHGTYSEFIINSNIIDDREVTADDIRERLEEKSYLYPNLNIVFTILKKGKLVKSYKYKGKNVEDRVAKWKPDTKIEFISTDKEVQYLKNITDDKLTIDKIHINVAFAFSEKVLDDNSDNFTISYANTIKTYAGGSHVDGVRQGLQKYFNNEVKLKGKDKELNILPSDIVNGLCMFIAVTLPNPEFRGQEKTQLSNPEVRYAVRDAVYDYLCNLKSTTAIVDFVKRVARGRMASKKTRKKDVSNAFSKDRLEKFKDIIQNLKSTDVELLLVEGQV